MFKEELVRCNGSVRGEGCPDNNLVLVKGFPVSFEITRCGSCQNKFNELKRNLDR